jgi:hypothetical protein
MLGENFPEFVRLSANKKMGADNYDSRNYHSTQYNLHPISLVKSPACGGGGDRNEEAIWVVCWDLVQLEELLVSVWVCL